METRRLKIPIESLDPSDEKVIGALRVYGALSFARTCQKLYVLHARDELPLDHGAGINLLVMACTFSAAALETVSTVAKLIDLEECAKGRWNKQSEKAFEYLQTEEVAEFRQDQLKRVRDKCCFHFDPDPAVALCQSAATGIYDDDPSEVTTLYEESVELGPASGRSPVADLMVARWFVEEDPAVGDIDRGKVAHDSAMVSKIITAVKDVADQIALLAFPNMNLETE